MGRIPGPVLHVAVYVPCSAGNPADSGEVNKAFARERTQTKYAVRQGGMQGQGRSTTRGVAKTAARGSRWLASWCIPGTQCIPPVRVDASPSTSSQHSRG